MHQEIKGGGGEWRLREHAGDGQNVRTNAGLADDHRMQKEEPNNSRGVGGGDSRGREWRSRQNRDKNLAEKGSPMGVGTVKVGRFAGREWRN